MEKDSPESTELRILHAAERLFVEQGFTKTTTAQIAREAQANSALLHYYFRTKELLFDRIVKSKLEYITGHILSAFLDSDERDIRKRILRATELHIDFMVKNRRTLLFVITAAREQPQLIDTIYNNVRPVLSNNLLLLQKELDAAAKRGEISHIDSLTLILDLLALNLTPLVIFDLAHPILDIDEESFIEARRQETLKIIQQRIAPKP
ncbi:MAG: TetR/AcrR family transcriptional regulator [Bacteroidales bacterium]|nr:TetR/AcrR family transcriptional regulator [Bacteroidales bacterium]